MAQNPPYVCPVEDSSLLQLFILATLYISLLKIYIYTVLTQVAIFIASEAFAPSYA